MRSESKRTWAAVGGFAVLAAAITSVILVVGGAEPAGATDLARFSSCEAMQTWVDDVQANATATTFGGAAERAVEDAAVAAPAAAGDEGAGAGEASTGVDTDTGGTNTVVAGVDEIDIVDRLPDGRALVARNGTLSLVDLDALTVVASVNGLPWDARISVGDGVVWVAGGSPDGMGVVVTRLRLTDSTLTVDGTWTTPGWLLDARRTGDRLHVVAVDQPAVMGALPFDGGPVPCDEVWRPDGGADTAAATLLATLPAEGDLQPTAIAEVVGSGSGFLVTETAAYVTTQTWTTTAETGVHRFDLATLTPTGSGTVPGIVPGPFGIDEHGGYLRIATSAQPAFGILPAVDVVGAPAGAAEGVAQDDTVVGAPVPPPTTVPTAEPLAEVFVLDLDGALDIVGRSGRFGHEGESIFGVRFIGDTAYVVTFQQTDPFWVLDLSTPASPTVVGQVEIPGFSAYLHPIDDTHLVGFGPDGSGRVAARLFDVSDLAAPAVVDELTLGDDTPVAYDHHAFVALDDGRFAVPVTDWPDVIRGCVSPELPVPPEVEPAPSTVEPDQSTGVGQPPCATTAEGGSTGVVVLAMQDGHLVQVDARSVVSDGSVTAERVLPTPSGGWVLVGYDRLVNPDGGELVLPQ